MKKDIDYSKVPEPVWQKHWDEFTDSMNKIEVSLRRQTILLRMIEHADKPN